MTTTTSAPPAADEPESLLTRAASKVLAGDDEVPAEVDPTPEELDAPAAAPVTLRPVLAAGLSACGTGLVVGGIYGSWAARIFGLAVAVGGALLAAWALRSKRPVLAQLVVPLSVAAVAVASVFPDDPTSVPRLVRNAVQAGRLLRPPVPFDPGWRPLLTVVVALLAFGSAWIASAGGRPVLGVVLPIPVTALAAITQSKDDQVLAGVFAFLPILAAFGVLYGQAGGSRSTDGVLDRGFEIRRALRGGAVMVVLAGLLIAAGNVSFLFPKPTYNPSSKPQKPKSVPLSAADDRVLFTVKAPVGFNGPWRTGVLDVYQDKAFELAGLDPSRFVDLPASGAVDTASKLPATLSVTLTTGDLGASTVLPLVPTTARVSFPRPPAGLKVDPRPGVLRVETGRAPRGVTYTMAVPAYPNAAQLKQVTSVTTDKDLLTAPAPPPAVQRLLTNAPPSPPFARLDYLRHQLLDHITAVGAGSPTDIDGAKVQDMLDGSKKATPFEIVAAQALLARWAGIPSRIGFGFNGVNSEHGLATVRPKNAAQWLEVRFDGFGWLPLLDVPPKAQADLNSKDKDKKILPSTDIAVEVFVPIEEPNPRLLFERVRAIVATVAPFLGGLLLVWLAVPVGCKALRRRRRERWADRQGPRARIAVAYAEVRDAATDLSVGDPFATPLEFLSRVQDDGEHTELAWLVSRAMYGDLARTVDAADADAAEQMAASLRRRLRQAQPAQVRMVAFLSKGSLLRPYTDEVPNVTLPTPVAALRRRAKMLTRQLSIKKIRIPLRRPTRTEVAR